MIEKPEIATDKTLIGGYGVPSPLDSFADDLAGKTLTGSYAVDAAAAGATLKTDSYRIAAVRRTGDETFVVEAVIGYGQTDLTIPVTVNVRAAGDVPVLVIDDLAIPMMGEGFGSKIVFDFERGRYAGTWRHGDVGGAMWGRIVETPVGVKPADDTPAAK